MMPHQVVRFRELPLTCLTFISEKAVVGAGHDFNPLVFTTSGEHFLSSHVNKRGVLNLHYFYCSGDGEWSFLDKLEKKKEEAVKESSSGFAASRYFLYIDVLSHVLIISCSYAIL